MAENPTPLLIVNAEEQPSDVLHQLDQLLNKHRSAQDSAAQVPTLTETLDEAPQADIPVLQDEAAVATTSDGWVAAKWNECTK